MAESSADLILYNANVLTLDARRPRARSVAVRGAHIAVVGDKAETTLLKGDHTRVIDCEGKTVVPGFNDAHCHPLALATTLQYVDCSPSKVDGIAGIQTLVRQRAEATGRGEWIRAAKYNETRLIESRHPTRWELDDAAPDHPVILVHDSGKECVLNSLALQAVGITEEAPDPSAGHLGRDPETGRLTGLVVGRNENVERGVPPLDAEERLRGVKLASEAFLSKGVTSVQDTTWSNGFRHWEYWGQLKSSGGFVPRVTMMVGSDSVPEFQARGLCTGTGDETLRLGGAKIALDESTGCTHPPQDEQDRHALRAHSAGFQLALHVSDVQGLQSALASLQAIVQKDPKPYERPRLEHCAAVPPALVKKLAAFEALIVTQPAFLYFLGETYRTGVAPEQLTWLYPLRSLSMQGVGLALSSDTPLFPCSPFLTIRAAATRKDDTGHPVAIEESVSAGDALRMHTLSAAYASLEEGIKGSITPGKLADLAVLSRDPTGIDPDEIGEIRVISTLLGGEIVWGEWAT